MALTKLKAIYSTLSLAVDYIINNDKTTEILADEIFVSTYHCNDTSVEFDFLLTQNLAKQVKGDYSKVGGKNILAWQIIQSFSPKDNITPKQAHEIGLELAKEFLEEKYEYILATHLDKEHLHNHIIFNATSFKTLKNFRCNRNIEHLRLRDISNNICKKNNLSILEYNTKVNRKQYNIEADISKKDKSFKSILKNDIDNIIKNSINFDNFIMRMQNLGYQVVDDKNGLSFKNNEQKYYTRLKSLGEIYSKENIINLIKNNKSLISKLEETPKIIREKYLNSINDLIEPRQILKSKLTWRTKLKYCIDYYIFKAKNFDEFLQGMQETGYQVKYGKHISFRCAGMDKNIRAKVLGENYTEDKIKERINSSYKILPKVPVVIDTENKKINNNIERPKISLKKLIDISNNDKYKNEIYYKKFVKKFNTENIIMTDNFMRKNNYTEEKLSEMISTLNKQIFEDKKELAVLGKDFEKLKMIKETPKNAEKIKLAYENLNRLKTKLERRLKTNLINLEEHKIVQANLKIYNKNQNIKNNKI